MAERNRAKVEMRVQLPFSAFYWPVVQRQNVGPSLRFLAIEKHFSAWT